MGYFMEDIMDISWDMEFDQLHLEINGNSIDFWWKIMGTLWKSTELGTQHSQWEFLMGYKQVTTIKAL